MDKVYDHKKVEDKLYSSWEEGGYFKPEVNPQGKPFTIILPPPNANGDLHFGHAMFTVEDILIRYHRMKGYAALWLPGTDHAGIETQFVFENKLRKEGKSRLDFSQEELYKMIEEFVNSSKGTIQNQLRKLGFSLDWSREKYTLDSKIVRLVYKTFKKMYNEGFIYRAHRLVNYCTVDGTSFSDLEVVHEEKVRPLYYIKYGPLTLATTRPETKFGDTAVAVHPDDTRYKQYIGKELEIETVLGKAKIKVIGDTSVDPTFGTGVVKITPAHDFNDFEVAKRHNLEMRQVINFDGKMNHHAGKFSGMFVKEARKAVVSEMQKKGLIEKIDENYITRLNICYKCKAVLEPLPKEQWFMKVDNLKKLAIDAVKKGDIKIHPKNFETIYFQWLEGLRDWNISRQIVWGMRIPAWQCQDCKIKNQKSKIKIESQNLKVLNNAITEESSNSSWIITEEEKPEKCPDCDSTNLKQDEDTFDTWFSSGQWPFATLKASRPGDFEKFYPTSVMETAYDILKAWVSRMVMLGLYMTNKVPFENVLFHGIVNDPLGKKMSKSKGNVVNPLELIEQYGADAVRFALVYGNATGNDQSLSYSKLDAARKFTNKLWNMARFIEMKRTQHVPFKELSLEELLKTIKHENDVLWIKKTEELVKDISKHLNTYQFNLAAERLYEFAWHEFADKYIEDVKTRMDERSQIVLENIFVTILKLLHPFMPFVTEELYQQLKLGEKMLIIEQWPFVASSSGQANV